ncbi:MAG: hypothetical protein ACM3O3_12355 [Syntrophothermus sp.]
MVIIILINIKCDFCNNIFKRKSSHVNSNKKNNYKNFCSKECFSQYSKNKLRKGSMIINCKQCNKTVKKQLSDYKKSKSGNMFCSHRCSQLYNSKTDRKHPFYKNGKSSYRNKALKYLENKCSVCGYDIVKILEVHHKDKNRENNDISNLDILCPTHHNEYQKDIRTYET